MDVLDFPLNPPDGDGVARGGGDFGAFRGRYDAYHVGEDWWLGRGQGSFGAPVYSIGHGKVTYAEPVGWGRDQGVVIIRHTFADGQQLLSFYGHLDPPSVQLSAGDCVRRGQQVGAIGRPRTPPHLHFEIRSHMPTEPGPGYWWQDPALDGWKAPSETIWHERMSASPGVEWLRPSSRSGSMAVGLQRDHTLVLLEDDQVIGLDVTDGEHSWNMALDEHVEQAALDQVRPMLYVADQLGNVEAFRLPDPSTSTATADSDATPESMWRVDLDVVGIPELIPLPQGGVALTVWNDLVGLSPEGEVLWQLDTFDRPLDWVTAGDQILMSTVASNRSLWTIDHSGARQWGRLEGGQLDVHDDQPLLYNDSGLYRLNLADRSYQRLSEWPQDSLRSSDMLALDDGRVLLMHVSRSDRRLILFEDDGGILWQRALPESITGMPSLRIAGGYPYLLVSDQSGNTGYISVFAVDADAITLTRLFDGGTRSPISRQNSAYATGNGRLLINIGGGHLVALNPRLAAESMATAPGPLPQ